MGISKKNIFILAGGLVLLIVAMSLFYIQPSPREQEQTASLVQEQARDDNVFQVIAEADGVVLMADTGLDIEWLVSRQDGRKEIFERYRLIKKADFEQLTGTENQVNSVDITKANAQVFLTGPNGKREEITSEVPYILFGFLPPATVGKYVLKVNLTSGEEYNFEFEFKQPSETEFVNTGKTITQVKPTVEEGKILTAKEQRLFDNLELTEKESRTLYAFKLGNLDLRDADKVFHMTPEGATYGGGLAEARDIVDIDEYFWLDIEDLNLKQTERNEFIQIARELENIDPDVAYELERLENSTDEHTFLAKIKGVWYYATVSSPF